jgi:hypothetical protein
VIPIAGPSTSTMPPFNNLPLSAGPSGTQSHKSFNVSFPNPPVGRPADSQRGPLMSRYSDHQPTESYLGSYTTATTAGPSSSFTDVTPFTNTNPPQVPAPSTFYPGNAGTLSPDTQGHMYPTFLQSPLPMTSADVYFFSQPPSR